MCMSNDRSESVLALRGYSAGWIPMSRTQLKYSLTFAMI